MIMAELGDLSRFDSAPQFMAYMGVVPGKHSSGSKVRRGSITKTGNGHVRKVIVEAAWSYRLKPLKSKALLQRQDGLDPEVRQISWEAQKRLSHRYRHLTQAGKKKPSPLRPLLGNLQVSFGPSVVIKVAEMSMFPPPCRHSDDSYSILQSRWH